MKFQISMSMCKMGLTGLHDSLGFMAFVHLPFSFRSLDLLVASLLFMKDTSYWCAIDRAMANFRS